MDDIRKSLDYLTITAPGTGNPFRRLVRLRALGRAAHLEPAIERSLDGAFALADFMDTIREAAEPK